MSEALLNRNRLSFKFSQQLDTHSKYKFTHNINYTSANVDNENKWLIRIGHASVLNVTQRDMCVIQHI